MHLNAPQYNKARNYEKSQKQNDIHVSTQSPFKDGELQANCFTLNDKGEVSEGFELTLGVQRRNGDGTYPPQLCLGHASVPRCKRNGCHFKVIGGSKAIVRRAAVERITPVSGGDPFHTLTSISAENPSEYLLHVKYGDGECWSEISNRSNGLVISANSGGALVMMRNGATVDVLFRNGRVRRVTCIDGVIKKIFLLKTQEVAARLQSAEKRFAENPRCQYFLLRECQVMLNLVKEDSGAVRKVVHFTKRIINPDQVEAFNRDLMNLGLNIRI